MSWAFLVTCDRGLEAALGHDRAGVIWLAMSIVGGADYAVLVGERVVGRVLEPALGVAERDAADVDAAVLRGRGR